MKSKIIISLSLFFMSCFSQACPVGSHVLSASEIKKLKQESQKYKTDRKISAEYSFPDALSAQPWGGKNPDKWKPEAILANAASFWLNKAW